MLAAGAPSARLNQRDMAIVCNGSSGSQQVWVANGCPWPFWFGRTETSASSRAGVADSCLQPGRLAGHSPCLKLVSGQPFKCTAAVLAAAASCFAYQHDVKSLFVHVCRAAGGLAESGPSGPAGFLGRYDAGCV